MFTPKSLAILTMLAVPTRCARSAKAELDDTAAALATVIGP